MDILTTHEVAELLKVRVQTVQQYIRKGCGGVYLVASRLGPKRYRIERKDLEQFVKATKTVPKESVSTRYRTKRKASQVDRVVRELQKESADEILRKFKVKS